MASLDPTSPFNNTTETTLFNRTIMPYYRHSTAMAMSYILSYILVLLFCVGGNGLVCLVVLRNRNMRSVTNLFILNLAISDLLVGVFCVPTTLIDSLISGWPFDQLTCTMSNLVQGMSVAASVFTLVAIAVDRFRGIVYPFRHRTRPVTALFAILFIWLLAFAFIFPSAATLTVAHYANAYMEQGNRTYPLFVCYEDWPRPEMRRIYTTVIFVHIYLAPLVVISVMYGCIAAKLSAKLRQTGATTGAATTGQAAANTAETRRGQRSRRRVRVIKMLIMVALLFMVSWLPLWTLWLMADYQDLSQRQVDFLSNYLFPVAHWLAFSNSGINPIIYGFFNENFRRGFQAAVACRSCASLGMVVVRPGAAARFILPPPNKVSQESMPPCGGGGGGRVPPPPLNGTQGILLQDVHRLGKSRRVMGAWVE